MSKVIDVIFAKRPKGFRGLAIGMSAKEIQAVEGKTGTLDGDVLSLDLGAQSLAVTFDDAKASEIRYSLELGDHAKAKAAFDELAACSRNATANLRR